MNSSAALGFLGITIDSDSTDEQRRRTLIRVEIWTFILGSILTFVTVLVLIPTGMVGSGSEVSALLLGSLSVFAGGCVIHALNERVSVDLAAISFLLLFTGLVAISDTPQQVINGRALFFFSLPITAASFNLRPWASFIAATLSTLVVIIYAALIGGVLPNLPGIIGFYALATIMWLSAETLNKALETLSSAREDIEAQRSRALLYLDLIGHDITNKLQAILMASDVLKLSNGLEPIEKTSSLIEDSVQECAHLSRQVKRTRNLYMKPLEPVSISENVRKALETFMNEHSEISVKADFEVQHAYVCADEFLQDLLLILLRNTVEHSDRDDLTVWIHVSESERHIKVAIADNGVGIPDDRKSQIFDSSRRYGGVGLHISKQIVDKYDGTIEITNRIPGNPSAGAKFIISLPKQERES